MVSLSSFTDISLYTWSTVGQDVRDSDMGKEALAVELDGKEKSSQCSISSTVTQMSPGGYDHATA